MQYQVGNVNHSKRILIYEAKFSDEYFWEFITPEQILENMYGLTGLNNLLARDIGFEITDTPDPLPRFHYIQIHAHIGQDSLATLLELAKK
jgi:hypothetical protein